MFAFTIGQLWSRLRVLLCTSRVHIHIQYSFLQEESLRLAIMDYVQRCHPSDTDTFKMVSLYFTMYREIAVMLEENAHKQLQGIRGKHLGMSSPLLPKGEVCSTI